MSDPRTVQIANISPNTTKEGLSAFLGFCGTIESVEIEGTSAKVVFQKESAAKTAELLDGGSLDGSILKITSSASASHPEEVTSHDGEIEQEHKPRTAVIAEVIAHGYVLSDKAIEQAIALDNSYGISARFLSFFKPLSEQAYNKAAAIDQQHHVTEKVTSVATQADAKLHVKDNVVMATNIGKNYYENALRSTWGEKVKTFYTQTAKQVLDVHEEARRIADSRKSSTIPTGGEAPETSAIPAGISATSPAGGAYVPTAGPSAF